MLKRLVLRESFVSLFKLKIRTGKDFIQRTCFKSLILLGEVKNGEVSGYHNWFRYAFLFSKYVLSNLNFAHFKKKIILYFCTFFAIKKIDQKANKWALFSVSRRDIRVH